jgi:group I intron endonuclease
MTLEPAPGIYRLTFPSGSCYVGSSINMRRRVMQHLSYLRRGAHPNPSLQAAYNKYSPRIETEAIEYCESSSLQGRERHWIDVLVPPLNQTKEVFCCMRDPVIAQKVSNSLKGRRQSEEHRSKLSAARKGSTISVAHRAKISQALSGKEKSLHTRSLLSSALKGRALSLEWRKKISDAKSGVPLSDESKAAISKATKGKSKSASMRKNLSEAKKRPVQQLCRVTGAVVKEFSSAKEACTELGLSRSSMSRACRNVGQYCGGFAWKFAS